MKNKLLFLIIAAVGALLITASNGFSKESYGDNLNDACAPVSPFTGNNCALCHDSNAAEDAYLAGGTTLTDYFCPTLSACTDIDGDGYGDPGASSCSKSATDCDDRDSSVYPGAFELCNDFVDNDCDGDEDCFDSDCEKDSNCLAASCDLYENRGPCKTDPRCEWSGKGKTCKTVSTEKADCAIDGGRWSKKNNDCIYR